jgi:predicted cupin superfamily sugar epimerase
MEAESIIRHLNMKPHPEGGYYNETYRSTSLTVNSEGNARNQSTAIYFLLENQNKSHFHRIKSDELWFFHQGEPLEILSIENGILKRTILGNDFLAGQQAQAMIPANTWFGSRLLQGKGFGLVSCTVSPGFDFQDFEMAKKENLVLEFPDLKEIIDEMSLD